MLINDSLRCYMFRFPRNPHQTVSKKTLKTNQFFVLGNSELMCWKKWDLNKLQHNLVCSFLFKLTTCFGLCFRPSSGQKIYVIMLEETIQCKSQNKIYKIYKIKYIKLKLNEISSLPTWYTFIFLFTFTIFFLQFSLHVSDRLVHHQENQITRAASGTFPSFVVISCVAVGAN